MEILIGLLIVAGMIRVWNHHIIKDTQYITDFDLWEGEF